VTLARRGRLLRQVLSAYVLYYNTMRPIWVCLKMHPSIALLNTTNASLRQIYLADCTTNMLESRFRKGRHKRRAGQARCPDARRRAAHV
jgi:hypothetical protein